MSELIQIPALSDNYIYLLIGNDKRALAVDPSEAAPVLSYLDMRKDVKLEAIITTHHHFDHIGGNAEIKAATGCDIVGPASEVERIYMDRPVHPGDRAHVAGWILDVLDVHAHTRGHIAYACANAVDRVVRHGHNGSEQRVDRLSNKRPLFVGDSLFLGGCGRLFEGTPEDLVNVMRVYRGLNGEMLVCCGHEYTSANLAYAQSLLPNDLEIGSRVSELDDQMGEACSSVPDILSKEFNTNVFLMCLDENHRQIFASKLGADANDVTAVMGALRLGKDSF